MLSNRRRPSSTAFTIDAKLSSVRTISAASLATSLPVPIAIPTFACLSAGESLTPSPVMTQKRPLRWRACTILTLVVGLHLAMTSGSVSIASTSSSVILSKSLATMTAEAGVRSSMMSTSLAMAFAVPGILSVHVSLTGRREIVHTRMVTSEHVDRDASNLTLADSTLGLQARWIIDGNKTEIVEVGFHDVTFRDVSAGL